MVHGRERAIQCLCARSARAERTVSARRMFGGVGYYADGLFFALAEEHVLYFRVDDSSRNYFVAEGAEPFGSHGPGHEIDELLRGSRATVR